MPSDQALLCKTKEWEVEEKHVVWLIPFLRTENLWHEKAISNKTPDDIGGNKAQVAYISNKGHLKITRSLTLVLFEQV